MGQLLHEEQREHVRSQRTVWSLGKARPPNTFDANRVIALSLTQGLDNEMNGQLFLVYFSQGALLSVPDTLSLRWPATSE